MTARSDKIQSVKEMDSAFGDAEMLSYILRYHLLMATKYNTVPVPVAARSKA